MPGPAAPARSRRRRRRRVPALVLGVLTLLLIAAGCKQDNTPQFYNSVTHDNFVTGCQGGSTNTSLAGPNLCECMYTVLTKTVPASSEDLKKNPTKYKNYHGKTLNQIESDVKNNPADLPSSLNDAWTEQCGSDGYKGVTTTTASGSGGLVTTTTG
jgi:hypothetical protein